MPATRGSAAPRRQAHDAYVAPTPVASDLPRPEFLSLTYTLPYHLVEQISVVAQSTNRSQSEILAESIRLYLKACAARQEHTRISTVEGFSYQEITVADATITTSPTVPPPHAEVDQPATPNVEEAEAEENPAAEEDTEENPQAGANTGLDEDLDGEAALPAPEVDEEEALLEIADPAADVRRRLHEIADEPLDSDSLHRCLEQIMRQVDTKDFSPPAHSTKVAKMARELGAAKGLRGQRLHEVYIAGLVHDIGKACIPDEIIKKPKPSSDEMALIRKYPEFGADLLRAVPAMEPVVQLVVAHQERWNGSGYPQGTERNDIPTGAQIVALCDVYDVLNTARRYRPAYSEDRALQIIKQSIGALWNPDVARIFLSKIVGENQKTEVGARS